MRSSNPQPRGPFVVQPSQGFCGEVMGWGGVGCIMAVQEYSTPNLNGWPDWSCRPSLAEDQVLLGAPPTPPGGPLFPALESLLQLGLGRGGGAGWEGTGVGGPSGRTLRPLAPAEGLCPASLPPSPPTAWLRPLGVCQAFGASHSCGSPSHISEAHFASLPL